MQKQQRYRGESLRRIQQFLDVHADVVGAVNSSESRRQLDAAIAALSTTVDVQGARSRESRGEKQSQAALELDLRQRHILPVATFARGKLASAPNISALTPSASKLRGASLVKAARAMALAAQPYTSVFTDAKFPSDFMQKLLAGADAVQASIDASSRKRADRQQATAAVRQALASGRSAALMLEAVVNHLIPRRSPLYAEWLGIKRIQSVARRTPAVMPVPSTIPASTTPTPPPAPTQAPAPGPQAIAPVIAPAIAPVSTTPAIMPATTSTPSRTSAAGDLATAPKAA